MGKFLDELQQQAHVIRSAPFAFAIFLAVGGTAGYLASNWYYSKKISDADDQIGRYQVVLGIRPGSPGALIELTNDELALRAQFIVARLRELNHELDLKVAAINKLKDEKKIDESAAGEQIFATLNQISQEFDASYASDALNIDNELQKRLDPKALTHIVRVPALFGLDGTRIPLVAIARNSFGAASLILGLADEIEQTAKLLPPGSAKR